MAFAADNYPMFYIFCTFYTNFLVKVKQMRGLLSDV